MRHLLLLLLFTMLAACGPTQTGDKTTPDAGDQTGPTGAISGVAWAPGSGPSNAINGEEIPASGALVSITAQRRDGIPDQVYCEACTSLPPTHTITSYDGSFFISDIPEGPQWLTIEKGQFRYETQVTITADQTLMLTEQQTTLPSEHDPAAGKWLPRVAIATADFDQLHTIFIKIGIGGGDYDEYTATNRIHRFSNVFSDSEPTMGNLEDLVSDYNLLKRYHIVMIPCSLDEYAGALQNLNVLRNIRRYVEEGGKLFITDWSGEWADNVFPASITLASGEDTPASAYDAQANTWNTNLFGDADGSLYNANGSRAVDSDLAKWLDGQSGPLTSGSSGPFDGSNFDVVDNWNSIYSTTPTVKGQDDTGADVIDTPKVWVEGPAIDGQVRPLTVTYEPTGCGRVMFSTYHTTPDEHDGLVPQERVLLYLLLEVGVCTETPVVQ